MIKYMCFFVKILIKKPVTVLKEPIYFIHRPEKFHTSKSLHNFCLDLNT